MLRISLVFACPLFILSATSEQPVLRGCYLAVCGCPPYVAAEVEWCANVNEYGNDAAFMAASDGDGYCHGSAQNCNNCNGVFCDGVLGPPPTPAAPPSPPWPPFSPPPPSNPQDGVWTLWQAGYATRYWDCCKPSCAWRGNVPEFLEPTRHCTVDGTTIPPTTLPEARSSCVESGPSHTCSDQIPRPDAFDQNLAYGFAATPGTTALGVCGACFELNFTGKGHFGDGNDIGAAALAGKRMIVQATNTGHDVSHSQFDLLVPGGGVGLFDACTAQWSVAARNKSLGMRYGGFLAQCQAEDGEVMRVDLPARKSCVRTKCEDVFGGDSRFGDALAGCLWFVDWFEAADNPEMSFRPVACPPALSTFAGSGSARRPQDLHAIVASPPTPPEMPQTNAQARTCALTQAQVSRRCRCSYQWPQSESDEQEVEDAPSEVQLTCL